MPAYPHTSPEVHRSQGWIEWLRYIFMGGKNCDQKMDAHPLASAASHLWLLLFGPPWSRGSPDKRETENICKL